MSQRQLQRLEVMGLVEAGKMKLKEGIKAKVLKLSQKVYGSLMISNLPRSWPTRKGSR